jgi:dolichol-phosphate mannosyltransferase
MAQEPVLSVVAPLHNEEKVAPELVRRIEAACRPLGLPFEILIVNDGSTDGTLPALVQLSRNLPELRVVSLSRRFGHMPALSAGLEAAAGQGVVVMDGDLQDPPELIPQFVAEWRSGAEVVYGLRTSRHESLFTRLGTRCFYWLLDRISDTSIPKQVGTFCLMDRRVAALLNRMPERDRYFAGLRAWVGGKQSFVRYDRPDRPFGRSKVGGLGLVKLARTALTSFSKAPLRYASGFSVFYGLTLFIVGLSAMLTRLFTNLAIPGWATTTTLIGMTGFVQGILLAIIAEYVAVIFDEVKARPLYMVRDEFRNGEAVKR